MRKIKYLKENDPQAIGPAVVVVVAVVVGPAVIVGPTVVVGPAVVSGNVGVVIVAVSTHF